MESDAIGQGLKCIHEMEISFNFLTFLWETGQRRNLTDNCLLEEENLPIRFRLWKDWILSIQCGKTWDF